MTNDFNGIKQEATTRMEKTIAALKSELSKLRTGRAHPSLLEQVMVSYYGTDTPLSQVASVNVGDARTLLVSPWEKNLIPEIEKAIRDSNLGLNPTSNSDAIRVPLPILTEDRRKELTKLVKQEAESARVGVRNTRRDANSHIKDLLKEKAISEDDERRHQDEIQKLTDQFVKQVDEIAAHKEAELMEV